MTSGNDAGPNGGQEGASGWAANRRRALLIALLAGFGFVQAAINALTRISDLRDAGQDAPGWHVFTDEATSLLAWFLCMIAIWQLVARLRPPRLGWPVAAALHLAATVPISLLHVALMAAFRKLAYRAIDGSHYVLSSDLGSALLYEYRKDAISYLLIAATMAAIQWFTRPIEPLAAPPAPDGQRVLEVSDGAITHIVPLAEIDWLEAAGNYVTLHWRGRALLHRATLASMEQVLAGEGIVRVHRSRLVRRSAIRQVASQQSGDFDLVLDDGTRLRGSRRYRAAIG
ncbi:MAG: LytTR family transcriptional regulator [Sphingomonadales bacterium]|nr:LytTR family transcriptional regulator [Sphingomonadales bacterium]MBD3772953.1 LytTR family transcriptional regulator [Paracoccaceae bacterium]